MFEAKQYLKYIFMQENGKENTMESRNDYKGSWYWWQTVILTEGLTKERKFANKYIERKVSYGHTDI